MAKHFTDEQISEMRKKLLVASARLFLTRGYSATTLLLISEESGVDKGMSLARASADNNNKMAEAERATDSQIFA